MPGIITPSLGERRGFVIGDTEGGFGSAVEGEGCGGGWVTVGRRAVERRPL